jgi:hypothetical protein
MKKLAIAVAVLVFLAGIASYNVWRANQDPVTTPPSPLDIGRQQLHAQLESAKPREAEIEQQDWNSVTLLRGLIKAHQQRIDELSGNSQAGEILAHDHDAIARLQKRIADLIAQEAAKPAPDDPSAAQPAQPGPQPKQQ